MFHTATSIEFSTATSAFIGARRAAMRRYVAEREVVLDRVAASTAVPSRLVAAGRGARPRCQMRCGGKHAHVGAGFGEHYLSNCTRPGGAAGWHSGRAPCRATPIRPQRGPGLAPPGHLAPQTSINILKIGF